MVGGDGRAWWLLEWLRRYNSRDLLAEIMHQTAFGLVPSLISVVFASAPSLASPFVYTTGGLLNTDLKTCMADVKSAATEAGFTEGQEEVLDDDKKDGTFYASKPDAPVSLAARCFPTAGVYSLAVSGINLDASWEDFGKFVDALLKK